MHLTVLKLWLKQKRKFTERQSTRCIFMKLVPATASLTWLGWQYASMISRSAKYLYRQFTLVQGLLNVHMA